jgi:D-galactarolactone cycloisomerase
MPLKITRVEPILLAVPYEMGGPKPKRTVGTWDKMECLLVRIDTDAGITGWGEAFGFAVTPVTASAIAHVLGPMCIGRDPEQIPELLAVLRRSTHGMGSSGPVRYALSGIDIALWDIVGKIKGRALHEMLGGAKRSHIPTYASLLPYHDVALVERNTRDAIAHGYQHVKLHETTVDTVAAARGVAGEQIALMLDTNCAWDLPHALEVAPQLEPYNLAWLEEPLYPPNDYAALAHLRSATTIKIAAGENVGSPGEAKRIGDASALDILMPDVAKIGGIEEMLEASAHAYASHMRVEPHSPFFGPAIVATLHILAAMQADALCERFYLDLEAYVLGDATAVHDGTMAVPQGPGLGITVDEDVIARYRIAT